MWVEELRLENIRCFESDTLRFNRSPLEPYKWITLLSENGGGKSTALQALALLLAGPEGAQQLVTRPVGWLRDESKIGKISTAIHQDDVSDPGKNGEVKVRRAFGYSYSLTGGKPLTVNNKLYTEPSIIPAGQSILTWLRANAFTSKGTGWFAVGYGAFRRLTRSSQIIVPSLDTQARFTNFSTQFNEDEPLSAFERWMVYLDYRMHKAPDLEVQRTSKLGIDAINKVLPEGAQFDSVTNEGRILFRIGTKKVPTVSLSDGYRSILALTGDLIWRLLQAFPKSDQPLEEHGVVLIDELDIHLHPTWQRTAAGMLRELFPNLQFIVSTHSPLVAAGAGEDALTYRLRFEGGKSTVERVPNVAAMSVDKILQSEAFGHVSPFSPQTKQKIDRYDQLIQKRHRRSPREEQEFQGLLDFMVSARPIGGQPTPGSLDAKVEQFLERTFDDKAKAS